MVALSQARHRVNVSDSLFSLNRGRLIKVAHSGGGKKEFTTEKKEELDLGPGTTVNMVRVRWILEKYTQRNFQRVDVGIQVNIGT